jgi:hypothetical protein
LKICGYITVLAGYLDKLGLEICDVIKSLDGFYGLEDNVGNEARAASDSPVELYGYDSWKLLCDFSG